MVDRESWRITLAAIESLLVGRSIFPAEEPLPPQQLQMAPTPQQIHKPSSFQNSPREAVGVLSRPVGARGGGAAVELISDARQAIGHTQPGPKIPDDGHVLPQQVPAAASRQPVFKGAPQDPLPQKLTSEGRPQSSRLDSEKAKRMVMHSLPRQIGEPQGHGDHPVSPQVTVTLETDRTVPSSRISSAPPLRGRGRGAGNASRAQGT